MILTSARNDLGPWGQKDLSKPEGIFSEEIKAVETECPRGCVGLGEESRAWPISGSESLASCFVPIASGRNWRAVMQSKGERWVREVPRRLCVFVCLFFLTFLGGVARERNVGVHTFSIKSIEVRGRLCGVVLLHWWTLWVHREASTSVAELSSWPLEVVFYNSSGVLSLVL